MIARKENGIYVVKENFEVNRYDFDGTAEQLKTNIDLIVERAMSKGMIGDGYFDFDLERGYGSGYEIQVLYYYDRLENDKEKAKREAEDAKLKAEADNKRKKAAEIRKLKKDTEYAEFLRLKAKFEND